MYGKGDQCMDVKWVEQMYCEGEQCIERVTVTIIVYGLEDCGAVYRVGEQCMVRVTTQCMNMRRMEQCTLLRG